VISFFQKFFQFENNHVIFLRIQVDSSALDSPRFRFFPQLYPLVLSDHYQEIYLFSISPETESVLCGNVLYDIRTFSPNGGSCLPLNECMYASELPMRIVYSPKYFFHWHTGQISPLSKQPLKPLHRVITLKRLKLLTQY